MLIQLFTSILVGYLIFALVGSTLPYALPKTVSPSLKAELEKVKFDKANSGDRIALLEDCNESFYQRVSVMALAENRLDIVYHGVHAGATTDLFFAEILRAADRGVKVRLMLGGKTGGLRSGVNKPIGYALSSHPNIEYVVYNRINLLTPWKWHTLLHDKFIFADEKIIITGGRNIGDKYFDPPGFNAPVSRDRDVLIYNTDESDKTSVLRDFTRYIDQLFARPETELHYKKLSPKRTAQGRAKKTELLNFHAATAAKYPELFSVMNYEDYYNYTLPVNGIYIVNNPLSTSKKEPVVGYVMGEFAKKAKRSVTIQTPYATGNRAMLKIMADVAAEKPLDIVTNSIASSPNLPAYSNYIAHKKKFIKTNASIYEFQSAKDSIHAKSMLCDDSIAFVGSYNLDDRSIYIDTETMVIVDSPEFHKVLSEVISSIKQRSLPVGGDGRYIDPDNSAIAPAKGKVALMYIVSVFSRIFEFLI